jgi:DNA (cytosine-5)-methyltransferase 1
LNVLDLFSGIGGFSLGLERIPGAFRTIAFAEIDPYCRRVLAARWPDVPNLGDVRGVTGEGLGPVDVITGGFPCQDISRCKPNERDGLDGEQSGLWSEYARLIERVRPRYAIVENVPELLVRGMGQLLGDLAAIGYDAEWEGIPAAAFGAPHLRARQWILSYPSSFGDRLAQGSVLARWPSFIDRSWWASEPGISRVDDGIPDRVDRCAATGNAVIPAIVKAIGHCILAAECSRPQRRDG